MWIHFAGLGRGVGGSLTHKTEQQLQADDWTYCKTPWAVFSPGPHRPPRWHTRSFSPATQLHKQPPQQPQSPCNETTVWTFRLRDAILKCKCPHIPRLVGQRVFWARCFSLIENLVRVSFSAGDQRRHVWRRSCCCSSVWKLHSCRSGLFSLGQSHKTLFRLDWTKGHSTNKQKQKEL